MPRIGVAEPYPRPRMRPRRSFETLTAPDGATASGATPPVADVEVVDVSAIAEVLAARDAVTWSAGAGSGTPARTYAVGRDAAIRTPWTRRLPPACGAGVLA